MKNTKLWIVGKVLDYDSSSWEFAGVFDSEEKAEDACLTEYYFTGLCELNERLPDERTEWPEGTVKYPKLSS